MGCDDKFMKKCAHVITNIVNIKNSDDNDDNVATSVKKKHNNQPKCGAH